MNDIDASGNYVDPKKLWPDDYPRKVWCDALHALPLTIRVCTNWPVAWMHITHVRARIRNDAHMCARAHLHAPRARMDVHTARAHTHAHGWIVLSVALFSGAHGHDAAPTS